MLKVISCGDVRLTNNCGEKRKAESSKFAAWSRLLELDMYAILISPELQRTYSICWRPNETLCACHHGASTTSAHSLQPMHHVNSTIEEKESYCFDVLIQV